MSGRFSEMSFFTVHNVQMDGLDGKKCTALGRLSHSASFRGGGGGGRVGKFIAATERFAVRLTGFEKSKP